MAGGVRREEIPEGYPEAHSGAGRRHDLKLNDFQVHQRLLPERRVFLSEILKWCFPGGIGPQGHFDIHSFGLLFRCPDSDHLPAVYNRPRIGHQLPDLSLKCFIRLKNRAVTLVQVRVVPSEQQEVPLQISRVIPGKRGRSKEAFPVR